MLVSLYYRRQFQLVLISILHSIINNFYMRRLFILGRLSLPKPYEKTAYIASSEVEGERIEAPGAEDAPSLSGIPFPDD